MDLLATISALAVLPVIFLEHVATDPHWLEVARIANWAIWWVFVIDVVVKTWAFGWNWLRGRSAWVSIAVIVVSYPALGEALASARLIRLTRMARLGRAGRLVRVLRLLRLIAVASRVTIGLQRILDPQALPYVALLVLLIVTIGGAALYFIELEPAGLRLEDALWWAVVTVTTVGYGDVIPQTGAGRVVAVVVMIVGIAFASLLTAEIAAYLNRRSQSELEDDVRADIRDLAAKVEQLSVDLGRIEAAIGDLLRGSRQDGP